MPLLTSRTARRTLRPLADLIDQRIERHVRRALRDYSTVRNTSDAALQEELQKLQQELQKSRSRLRPLELFFDGTGRGMARLPSAHHIDQAIDELAQVTGDKDGSERNVAQAFRLLIAMEALGVGRIAGGTMNIVGKLSAVPLLDPPNDEVLEIGTLYGMFGAALIRMLERAGREPKLTIVDPLAGTQLQPGASMRDDASGAPVQGSAVRVNLALAGAAGAATRVQQGFSEDPEVRALISDRSYGVIIVDGDHSAAGVAADLEWAEQIIAPGGIVVLDDFGHPKWPGIKEAFEKHMAGETRFTFLGHVAHSGYLKASA
ncbi:class I SAM-dependent methyltransferase [Streptomyces sp. ME02-8801-2C]|uniref:class I SAM-dependent methyltransferase n=1 Tax=Streptomyces sp. ME02-8801-2C TaxID=3028680 RepID=UPI0029ACEFB3|nr:class I SAM-dependent methyltransferase [Streptomyces sp. ME02-8801-2C]MDX3452944.1 class I SAM-dependent methyltransferase [Streptomyces sp. ME02-8801-2C]